MSWSFEFTARRARALKLAEDQRQHPHVPSGVVDFVQAAVNGVPVTDKDDNKVFVVKSNGHLCRGTDYVNSNDATSVNVLTVDG
jgi:hypothetical protein